MNKIEQVIYDLVKSKPWLKLMIRDAYQGIFDLLPKKKEFSVNPIVFKENYFFGFHDLIPFSLDNSKILVNELKFDLKMPFTDDEINVGYLDFDGTQLGTFHTVGKTRSWNYHKGCRSQWINDKEIIFNRPDKNDNLKSQIVNVITHKTREIGFPIDSISYDGKWASSFSYERLQEYMPGYGYAFKDDYSFIDESAPDNTGFYLIDVNSNSRKLLVSLKELANLSRDEELSAEANHYVTHSEFSPDGKYVSFFHRWVGEDTRKRYTQLIIYNLKTETYEVAPTGYMVSHYIWNFKNQIIAYCNYQGIDSHVLLNVEDYTKSHNVAYPLLNSDGHQSFINNTSFVTDTYPDKYRMSKLYKVNINTNDRSLLASVYSPEEFQTKTFLKHIACDLHPRVSKKGDYVCFDTAKSGKRSIAVMALKNT